MPNKRKMINDPVFGFINIPNNFIYDIIQHPYFQRLNRIKQLGLSSVVYPGAQHTRFQHSLGAMYLMGEAIAQLRWQGHEITAEEENAALACILLHDIGHGPFSHSLEHSLVSGVNHEELSLLMMQKINVEFDGKLELALEIFRNKYPKKYLHQLVSSQLDMDRIDYLSRDSFYSGVSEGIIGGARIIEMLNLHNGELVVDVKGIYSIEKFLVARRLMYWQVYLHKTSVAAEKMLLNILKRAKQLASEGIQLFSSPALHYFLYQDISKQSFSTSDEALDNFALLDDSDIICAIKAWSLHTDIVLSALCKAFMNRRLFKVNVSDKAVGEREKKACLDKYIEFFGINIDEAEYFIGEETVSTDTYNPKDDRINILYKDGTIKDIADASDMLNINVLTKKVEKNYFCYYRL
ncbi:HD domain-containing protein [Paludibacter sp. 221]|uniref:HD domain-containing protein n=1 Tax=Paludibacter sp. 221 TaxID=2302939 RepID=UPI0013D0D71F